MTGVLNAVVGSFNNASLRITVGSSGAGAFGFVDGNYGSSSPATILGRTLNSLVSSPSTDLQLQIPISGGTLGASFFKYLLVDTGSSLRQFTAATAGYSSVGAGTIEQWQWAATTPVWDSGDNGQARSVLIVF